MSNKGFFEVLYIFGNFTRGFTCLAEKENIVKPVCPPPTNGLKGVLNLPTRTWPA